VNHALLNPSARLQAERQASAKVHQGKTGRNRSDREQNEPDSGREGGARQYLRHHTTMKMPDMITAAWRAVSLSAVA